MSFDFIENFTVKMPDFSKSDVDFSESFNSKHGLIIEVAAIHEGLTSNYNHYSATELEKALQSWVEPYPKPIILNHDLNNEPIGRVIAARMDKEEDGTSFVRLQVAITDPVAAQKVLDRRYLTGSVGGRASKAICSISGEDLATEDESGRPRLPKFKRGKVYKGKMAYIDMQDISFKEYSFVNLPADSKSGVRSAKSMTEGSNQSADNWVAKSAAFVLHMDSEDIVSVENNKSILKEMKKKESKPTYLHLKGAFLSALALHESENGIHDVDSLLSSEDSKNLNPEENHNMDDVNKDEDILAVATGLSEDLSIIAATANSPEESDNSSEETKADEDVKNEEVAEQTSPETDSDDAEDTSSDDLEEAEVQNVDSENAGEPEESSSTEDEVQEEVAEHNVLNDGTTATEQDVVQLNARIALLEEENTKLKTALHMTLVERVIDTKINLGLESTEDREKLIAEHVSRTASSLADSLRDLAKIPAKGSKRVSSFLMPEVSSEAEVSESEDNVVTLDKVEEEVQQISPVDSFEQLLVDALMGRRKL